MTQRCPWSGDPLLIEYHDKEWGVPVHDDDELFQHLMLDCAQAGLSWSTILRKREAYREAFDGFIIDKVARYDEAKIESLLRDPGIVRNRRKIEAVVVNAKCVLAIQEEIGSFDDYLWSFVGGTCVNNRWSTLAQIPTESEESRCMSSALRERGFKFVGPTICYAFMQAVGMVNDHLTYCFRHDQV